MDTVAAFCEYWEFVFMMCPKRQQCGTSLPWNMRRIFVFVHCGSSISFCPLSSLYPHYRTQPLWAACHCSHESIRGHKGIGQTLERFYWKILIFINDILCFYCTGENVLFLVLFSLWLCSVWDTEGEYRKVNKWRICLCCVMQAVIPHFLNLLPIALLLSIPAFCAYFSQPSLTKSRRAKLKFNNNKV